MRKEEAGGDRDLNRAVSRLVAQSRPGLQLVSQAIGGFAPAANEAEHVIGELVHVAVRGRALDEGEGVIHVCLV